MKRNRIVTGDIVDIHFAEGHIENAKVLNRPRFAEDLWSIEVDGRLVEVQNFEQITLIKQKTMQSSADLPTKGS